MQQLDEPMLTAALGEWLSDREIRAVLERRDRMAEILDAQIEENGEGAVLLRCGIPPDAAAAAVPAVAPAPADDDDVVNRLLAWVDEALPIAPSSELTWMGTVVELVGYQGRYGHIAEAGAHEGHTLGLLIDDEEGLLCLTASERDRAPYEWLAARLVSHVEIFDVQDEETGVRVVQVTVSRIP